MVDGVCWNRCRPVFMVSETLSTSLSQFWWRDCFKSLVFYRQMLLLEKKVATDFKSILSILQNMQATQRATDMRGDPSLDQQLARPVMDRTRSFHPEDDTTHGGHSEGTGCSSPVSAAFPLQSKLATATPIIVPDLDTDKGVSSLPFDSRSYPVRSASQPTDLNRVMER